jgi:predicted DCC family thiol-disulfide oxidoreductase YuxK
VLAHERAPSTLFVAIQSKHGRDLAGRHGVDPDTPSTFLFIDGGRALHKSDGVIAVARHLRWPWRALTWGRHIPRRWRDSLYDALARNRYRVFGRHDRCAVPPPDVRARFVMPE